ncbi:MAG: PAS domain-containing protein [Gammaproteobacteria bacterium]|nr:PAS domain-containing protein [Gammaproteobacteria bacterium]
MTLLLALSVVGLSGVVLLLALRLNGTRAQLDRSSDLANAMRSSVLQLDARGGVINANSQAAALFGLSKRELTERNITDLIPALTPPFEQSKEMESTTGMKGEKPFLANVRLRRGLRSKERIFAIVRDITREEEMIATIAASQKLHTIGEISGGIAHDYNNHLTVILGYADEILEETPPEPIRSHVGRIREAAERSAKLTRQLLTLGRRDVTHPRVIDLNVLISQLDGLLRSSIGEAVVLDCVQAGGLGRIRADATQIEQVLTNLVSNARDAVGGRGKVTIETANVYLDQAYAQRHPSASPGRYVMLAVSDNGPGIAAELHGHIFEPFFTTKPHGTGLGLATVRSIVERAGGVIHLYSEPGDGTTFKIYLPRVEAAPDEPRRPPAGRRRVRREGPARRGPAGARTPTSEGTRSGSGNRSAGCAPRGRRRAGPRGIGCTRPSRDPCSP